MHTPKWELVAEAIRSKIRDGTMAPGAQLPTIKELCVEHNVSYGPVYTALTVLKTEGWVRGHQGRGTYVVDAPPI